MKNIICSYLNKIADCVAKLMRTRPLAVFSATAFLLIIMRLYINVQPLVLLIFFIGPLLFCLKKYGKIDAFIAIFIFISTLVGIFSASYGIYKNEKIMTELDGETVRITGHITSVPAKGDKSTTFYLDTDNVYYKRGEYDRNFKIFVRSYENYNLKFGDKITFNATMKRTKSDSMAMSTNLIAKGAPLTAQDITIIDIDNAGFPKNVVSGIRNYILSIGDRFFTGEGQMLFKALVAGDKTTFSDNLTENLAASGLSHIAAVSGLHVSILGMAVYKLLKKVNRTLSLVVSIVFVFLFALITGASPSTIRATIMFSSFLTAKIVVRESDGLTALCLSAMVLAVINPYVIYDWGFILSFLSVLGIQIFNPFFRKILSFLPKYVADAIAMTVSAQIMTLPAVTNMFGALPMYSIPANVIVSGIFLVTLNACIIFVFISFVPYVNLVGAAVTGLLLKAVAAIANLFADLPFSLAHADAFDVYECIAYYTVILLFVFRKKISEYFAATVILLCAFMLIFTAYYKPYEIKEYEICENSVLIKDKDKSMLVAEDNLYDVYLEMRGWGGNVWTDEMIVSEYVNISPDALKGIVELTGVDVIYISQNADDINLPGLKTEYYPKDIENLKEYAKTNDR